MTTADIRTKYREFFAARGHAAIPRANLVPQEDPTTLFTGSGMQPLIPYLLGAEHPQGRRLVGSQTCFRAEDIDAVGDNRHTTLFEMLGNWSLGDYFKAEQLPWYWEFITEIIGLDPQRLYVSVFIGDEVNHVPRDDESADIWKKLFASKGIEASKVEIGSSEDGAKRGVKPGERIFYYDVSKNWWSRSGRPDEMPAGEIGGPDSEMFYEFTHIPHDSAFGENCHPNCDCGRFIEIGNSVFIQYQKQPDGHFKELPQRNVDFGGGLERIAAAVEGSGDMFRIDIIWPVIAKLEELTGVEYADNPLPMRVIADHVRAAVWLVNDGVSPSNKEQGYVLRRFARRAIRQGLSLGIRGELFESVAAVVIECYKEAYPELELESNRILDALTKEEEIFRITLERGLKEFVKAGSKDTKPMLNGYIAFKLFDTYGFPLENSIEEAEKMGWSLSPALKDDFSVLMTEQRERSRTATAGVFKGGLSDHSEMTTKYHTATHLMYKALKLVLGEHVVQRGSNITPERLRFDFSHDAKLTPEEIAAVERIVNENIAKDWPMGWREVPTVEAFDAGALGAFGDKYGDTVKVYTAGDPDGEWFSQEICGGPHVEHTGTLGEGGKRFKITKEESPSAGVRRIKAVLE